MIKDEMPVGFAMALSMNPDAMQKFSTLSEEKKKKVIEGTHKVKSKAEMHNYVDSIIRDKQ